MIHLDLYESSSLLPSEDCDVYSMEGVGELLDDDKINPTEFGFMMGYLAG